MIQRLFRRSLIAYRAELRGRGVVKDVYFRDVPGEILSFFIEMFPSKKGGAVRAVLHPALEAMSAKGPDFLRVTCGAGCGTAGQSTAEASQRVYEGIRNLLPEYV